MSTQAYLTPHQKLAWVQRYINNVRPMNSGPGYVTPERVCDAAREILEDLSQHYGVPNPIDKFSSTHTPTPKV